MQRVLLRHPSSGLVVGLAVHASNPGRPFNELTTGLDHIAFSVADRAELQDWLRWFERHGVDHSPINEGVTGWVVTFRDPDNIQLEVYSRTK
jgi:glyoxylase I family protein